MANCFWVSSFEQNFLDNKISYSACPKDKWIRIFFNSDSADIA